MKMLLSVLRETIVGPWNGEYQGFFCLGGGGCQKKKKDILYENPPFKETISNRRSGKLQVYYGALNKFYIQGKKL